MSRQISKTKGFRFKQFEIDGGQCGMPVSTDGVLLGAWSNIKQANSILDIGTGTGLLALMCAQRNGHAKIEALDIDLEAAETAKANFANSPWHTRLNVSHCDLIAHRFKDQFDAIICNPPYFNNGEQANNQQRATARHTDSLSHTDLLKKCKSLLSEDGNASFVLPITEGEAFIRLALEMGFALNRRCDVRPTETKPVNRLLIELSLAESHASIHQQLTIRNKLGYTEDFIALTKDFYLKM
ncbi:tRNA1(Val) (adenine(37)-N6)-methyltransferase [Vibrio intestinalis]|uniref:tRNA1(Val) (adenine(37)-N6)-methyltransferase n=1 Tax=Vibrio intestinalis TaxID=2933291 RepID=UPI0021A6FA81|nr:tRNA1(Val) (adenine(37)-N6)-methyltransferase [Vibrio intestinalis]